MTRLATFALISAGLVGCASNAPEGDGRDDAFTTDGKLDGFQCTPQEAAAILKVANTATRATLENDVQLAEKAIDNILAVREGDDGSTGTSDDVEFATLAQLDAVPYIGPAAFQKLLDYVHDADLVLDDAPRAWTSTTIANGTMASFALTKTGQPVVVYKGASGFVLRKANGDELALPADANPANQSESDLRRPQVAVESNGTIHVVYGVITSGQPTQFKHLTVAATGSAFTDRTPLAVDRMWLDAGPSGQIFALAHKYRASSYNDDADASLVTFGANGATSSEPLWEMAKGASIAFNVGSDGFPALAWAGTSDAYTALRYARRGANGWQEPTVPGSNSYRYADIGVSGTASSLVIVDGALFRQSGQSVTRTGSLEGLTVSSLDAQVDENGTVHVCAMAYSQGTVHAEVDATGNYTQQALGQGGCWFGLDDSGTLHRLYALGSIINHAVYE